MHRVTSDLRGGGHTVKLVDVETALKVCGEPLDPDEVSEEGDVDDEVSEEGVSPCHCHLRARNFETTCQHHLPTPTPRCQPHAKVECVVANLIYSGHVKGYVSHKQRVLVLSKTNPFPLDTFKSASASS